MSQPGGRADLPSSTRMPRGWQLLMGILILGLGILLGSLLHLRGESPWAAVVAALGASVLTALTGMGLQARRDAHAAAAAAIERKRAIYAQFITAAHEQIQLTTLVHQVLQLATKRSQSGLIPDRLAFLQEIQRASFPMFTAWGQIWLHGSPEAIRIANRFVNASTPAMSSATAPGAARHWLVALFLGEAWTNDQEGKFTHSLAALGRLRIEFAERARTELGEGMADILAGLPPVPDTPQPDP